MLPHTNQGHQEHWQGGYQIFYTKQVFIPKHLNLTLRSASTSNAFSGGLYLTEIAKVAGWANVETFGKFYNKPVIDNNFENFLLNL